MPTADERLETVRLKIKWAEHHLGYLFGAMREFLESRPYKVRAERHPQTRQPIYHINSIEETPLAITATIGDTIQNLRSALDHLAWELTMIACAEKGVTLSDREKRVVCFPITNDTTSIEYEATLKRKIKVIRNDALDKIRRLNPYKGGNDTLWRLNELNNIDKHRFVLTAGLSVSAISAESVLPDGIIRIFPAEDGTITSDRVAAGNLLLILPKPIFPLQKDTYLFSDVPDAKIDLDDYQKFRFQIAFSEAGIIEAKPVYDALVEFRNYVNRVILSFRDNLT